MSLGEEACASPSAVSKLRKERGSAPHGVQPWGDVLPVTWRGVVMREILSEVGGSSVHGVRPFPAFMCSFHRNPRHTSHVAHQ